MVEYFEKEDKLPHERSKHHMWMLCAEMLLWTEIYFDGVKEKSAVSPVIQQAHGNIIPLLDKASSREAMISMLSNRLNPVVYQRPTASPSKGHVENAISVLGDFTNRILTLDEAAALPHAIVLQNRGSSSSMIAFQEMLKTSSSKNPARFAIRCSTLSTLTDLLSVLRSDPNKRLEIKAKNLHDVYVASSTLEKTKMCVPHMWAFTGTRGKLSLPSEEWSEVAVINPLYEYTTSYKSVLFLLENVAPPKTITNCCFPEFLEVRIRRTCRTAFEEINRRIHLNVDTSNNVGIGVGACATNEKGDLRVPVMVRLDGREFMITRL